jgi:hypothetical protein
MAQGDAREHPEYGAAVANALLVLIGPMALMLAGALMPQCSSDTNVTVRATGAPDLRGIVPVFLSMAWGLVPAAAVAGWRTLVLARRWREHERGDWRGVAEAGACGPAVALTCLRQELSRDLPRHRLSSLHTAEQPSCWVSSWD